MNDLIDFFPFIVRQVIPVREIDSHAAWDRNIYSLMGQTCSVRTSWSSHPCSHAAEAGHEALGAELSALPGCDEDGCHGFNRHVLIRQPSEQGEQTTNIFKF